MTIVEDLQWIDNFASFCNTLSSWAKIVCVIFVALSVEVITITFHCGFKIPLLSAELIIILFIRAQ